MRTNIVHPGAGELHYEIRAIVEFALTLQATGMDITWENIGDPVTKGETVPKWIRDIVAEEAAKYSMDYGYAPTKGLDATREYLAKTRSLATGANLTPDNILFFNGLGDAINKVYTWLNPKARILGPSPAYPTHSSVEAAHGRGRHHTYRLHSDNNWLPDPKEIREFVERNRNIAGLLIINPDNPTGVLYPREILEEMVAIAKEHKLLLIVDEIYANLTYDMTQFTSMAALCKDVPTIVMRGLSKEVPWPGSRCGWLEFYNLDVDEQFSKYVRSIVEAKMTEVSSTTLPQAVLPDILSDKRYQPHLEKRRKMYEGRADVAVKCLSNHPRLQVVKPKGAFYLSVTFNDNFEKQIKKRKAANPKAQKLLDNALNEIPTKYFDKRICYRLLATTGICVVPLTTGFNSWTPGFRMTLLENDEDKFRDTLKTIRDFVA